jgi:hypothetical protein
MVMRSLALAALIVLAACADRPADGADPTEARGTGVQPANDLPTTAEIVCKADGSTTLLTPEIEVRPDGFGLVVRSELDEPASLNGFGMDVEPGVSEQVVALAPGTIEVACWPFSQHGHGPEPTTTTLMVHDPDELYVSPELECPAGDAHQWSMVIDHAAPVENSNADEAGSRPQDPISAVRGFLTELEPGDELTLAGYPEQERAPVVLIRDGNVVASVGVGTWEDGTYYVAGASGCTGVQTAY